MKAYKLIAGTAAILLTFASLRAVLYNVHVWTPTSSSVSTPTHHVTDLAPIMVHPSAAERREAALIKHPGSLALISLPAVTEGSAEASIRPLELLGSQLAMPYYSFGKKFGRIIKE
ncbi:MAG TPA: hypothetical protein VGN24_08575 [Rhodanobacter sp.]|jgi:hypothetical protein|nr:hypothetical protein [Rhodanobacter sp.]